MPGVDAANWTLRTGTDWHNTSSINLQNYALDFPHMDMCCWCVLRLNRERISELQQQVEDLQKALQTQGSKPEDVSVFFRPLGGAVFAKKIVSDTYEARPDFAS